MLKAGIQGNREGLEKLEKINTLFELICCEVSQNIALLFSNILHVYTIQLHRTLHTAQYTIHYTAYSIYYTLSIQYTLYST